jgi:hypothetical protein
MNSSPLKTLVCLLTAAAGLTPGMLHANGRPCKQGLKGGYVIWSKAGSTNGTGAFSFGSGRVAVLPGFAWNVSGKPLAVRVGTDEPFSGGNSMKGFYGQADDATNLNIRVQANDTSRGSPIPHNAVLTIQFDAATPASGWGFSVIDLDVDQVTISATDASGAPVPKERIARWFIQKFDANPSADGVNIPAWDAVGSAVVGSSSSSTRVRSTVEGNLPDTEAASAWFQPNVSLKTLTLEYESLQETATPSYHVLIGACATTFVAPTPTPMSSGDSDGDTIPDATEGSDDGDNDDMPNYLDLDSDGDTIPDSTEGTDDSDGDGNPDYLDGDSDGDDVSDRIERDADGAQCTETNLDANRDGIDDGVASCSVAPLSDDDTDGSPDLTDSDSDNDGKNDGDEAYDMDGDGDRDVEPSGEDSDDDGIDDAFESFTTPDDLNLGYVGEANDAPCTSTATTGQKSDVLRRLAALADRVPQFAQRVRGCGKARPQGLVRSAAAARRAFEVSLDRSYANSVLSCPATVCPAVNAKSTKAALLRQADTVFRYAKQAKQLAQRACPATPSTKPETRPRTEAYLSALQAEIRKLPSTFSDCQE